MGGPIPRYPTGYRHFSRMAFPRPIFHTYDGDDSFNLTNRLHHPQEMIEVVNIDDEIEKCPLLIARGHGGLTDIHVAESDGGTDLR